MEPISLPVTLGATVVGQHLAGAVGTAAVGGVIGNRVDAVFNHGRKELFKRLLEAQQKGQLPVNHDLERAMYNALRQAGEFFLHSIGPDLVPERPLLKRIDWVAVRRLEKPLIQHLEDLREPEKKWLKALGRALRKQDALKKFRDGEALPEGPLTRLQNFTTANPLAATFHAEFIRWAREIVGSEGAEPAQFAEAVTDGWALPDDADSFRTVFQAFCLFFQEELKTSPQANNAFVAQSLHDLFEAIKASTPNPAALGPTTMASGGEEGDWLAPLTGTLNTEFRAMEVRLKDIGIAVEGNRADLAEILAQNVHQMEVLGRIESKVDLAIRILREQRRPISISLGLLAMLGIGLWSASMAQGKRTHERVEEVHETAEDASVQVNAKLDELLKRTSQAVSESPRELSKEELLANLASLEGITVDQLTSRLRQNPDPAAQALAEGDFIEVARIKEEQAAKARETEFENLMSAGRAYSSAYRFADALRVFERALSLVSPEHLDVQWKEAAIATATAALQFGIRTEGRASREQLARAQALVELHLRNVSRDEDPQGWAAASHLIGRILNEKAVRQEGEWVVATLLASMEAYRAALEVRTREDLPLDWAATQNNLGIVLREIGLRTSGDASLESLRESEAAYRAALEVHTRKDLPQGWAQTQNNLGNVLREIGLRTSGTASLESLREAEVAYRAALEVRTREFLPQQWAMTQINLGNVFSDIGLRTSGTASLESLREAEAAYRAAMEVYTHEDLPQYWAMTQKNLGNVLREIGQRSSGKAILESLRESETAYRAALEVYTRDELPQVWAMTQNNLGAALKELALRSEGDSRRKFLLEAIACYDNALLELTAEHSPNYHEIAARNRAEAKELLEAE